MPNLVISLNWTPIFESYVVRCGFKNTYPKDMSFQEFGLHAQIMITILSSLVNIIGEDIYDQLLSMRIFDLTMN